MAQEFRLQDPGEGIHEAEIREILVKPGDEVAEGDIVLLIETDKAAVEIPSPFGGVVEDVPVETGQVVRVGELLMTIGDAAGGAGGEAAQTAEPEGDETEEAAEREGDETKESVEPERPSRRPDETEAADVDAEAEKAGKARPKRGRDEERGGRPVPASPATRRVARELGVDLREVTPSGEDGRVLVDDVRAAAERRGETTATPERPERKPPEGKPTEPASRRPEAREPAKAPELPDFSRWGPVEREPMPSVRRATARRMAQSWSNIPHVTHQDLVDITELEAFRRRHADAVAERGGRLTLTAFALKAAAGALAAFPRFNASLDAAADEIILKRYCHIGVALETDRGLLVPVIRDVDRKSLIQLAVELAELADRLRADEASREDLSGGTFTITNVGGLGGTGFTPIINHPQVAILGMARARLHPIVAGSLDDHRIVARLMLPICVAFDHRVVDGAEAAHFTARIGGALGDPEQFALSV